MESNFISLSDVTEENINELAEVFADTGNAADIADYCYALFTPREIADLAKRWALVKALAQKIPQREIARSLQISLCKITRGSRELKKPDSAFHKMLEYVLEDEDGDDDD
jgi:TrpR family trp operon transcriptional repressor